MGNLLEALVAGIITEQEIASIVHLAVDPLGYYLENTAKPRTLIQCAVSRRLSSDVSTANTQSSLAPPMRKTYESMRKGASDLARMNSRQISAPRLPCRVRR
jgi:hypothetical protein